MRLLLICAGGYSTSMLVKKLEKYASENNVEPFVCEAHSCTELAEIKDQFEVCLYGPQVSNRVGWIKEILGPNYPVAKIEPADYAIGNAPKIFALIDSITKNK